MSNFKISKDLTVAIQFYQLMRSDVFNQLARCLPIGTRVSFNIMHGQINCSTGVICKYEINTVGQACIVVWHEQAKSGSRYRNRTVQVAQILSILGAL
jgi:hypothetical protein